MYEVIISHEIKVSICVESSDSPADAPINRRKLYHQEQQ